MNPRGSRRKTECLPESGSRHRHSRSRGYLRWRPRHSRRVRPSAPREFRRPSERRVSPTRLPQGSPIEALRTRVARSFSAKLSISFIMASISGRLRRTRRRAIGTWKPPFPPREPRSATATGPDRLPGGDPGRPAGLARCERFTNPHSSHCVASEPARLHHADRLEKHREREASRAELERPYATPSESPLATLESENLNSFRRFL